jgi:hypothetical protein
MNITDHQNTTWTCNKCGESKPISAFRVTEKRRWRSCTACLNAQMRAWNASPRGQRWGEAKKLSRYGLTIEQYEAILAAQGGVCAICRKPEPAIDPRTNSPRKLAVDHCHVSGTPRGLLCVLCNQGIGQFREDPLLLGAAIDYLQKHSSLKHSN